jgi:hypothetical protein
MVFIVSGYRFCGAANRGCSRLSGGLLMRFFIFLLAAVTASSQQAT